MTHYLQEDLLIPALKLLRDHPDGLTMTQLIREMTRVMGPTGADLVPTGARTDSRFSQQVRNLRSHHIFDRGGHVVRPMPRGPYSITATGIAYLEEIDPIDQGLRAQGTPRAARKREFDRDYTDVIVEEGVLSDRKSKHRTRSRLLRRAAVREFRRANGGRLFCSVCGFDFEVDYGAIGQGYAEMHHTTPLHVSDASSTAIGTALADGRLVPLCANCHRMAHKKTGGAYTVAELQRARTTKARP